MALLDILKKNRESKKQQGGLLGILGENKMKEAEQGFRFTALGPLSGSGVSESTPQVDYKTVAEPFLEKKQKPVSLSSEQSSSLIQRAKERGINTSSAETAVKEANLGVFGKKDSFTPSRFGKEVAKEVGGIGQGIARNITSAVVDLAKLYGSEKESIAADEFPKILQPIARTALTEEPVKSATLRIAEMKKNIENYADTVQNPIISSILKGGSGTFAFGIVMGSIGLDLSVFGGAEKNAIKKIVTLKNEKGALQFLRDLGVEDDVAQKFVPGVIRAVDEKSAKEVLMQIAEEQTRLNTARGPAYNFLESLRKEKEFGKLSAATGNDEARALAVSLRRAVEEGRVPQNVLTDFYTKAGSVFDNEAKKIISPMQEIRASHINNFYKNPEIQKVTDELRQEISGLKKSAAGAKKTLPENDPIFKLTKAIIEAKPVRIEQEALYSAERSKRIAEVAKAGREVPGEKGFIVQKSKLKGEYPKAFFESVRNKFTQKEIDSLFNRIQDSYLLEFEKINAKEGLAKLFGATGGGVPTRSELELLRHVFPPEFISAVLKKTPIADRLLRNIGEVLNIPRSIMASIDLSAPFRQGIFLIGRPKQFFPAMKDMFKYAFSEKAYVDLMKNIARRPTYGLMKDAKLALTDIRSVELTAREELFMSRLAERIPGLGRLIHGSNRAYTGFLNKLRADVFDDMIKAADRLKLPRSQKRNLDIAKFINNATGRGSLYMFERSAVLLNATFFSPRLLASRLNLVNPVFYITLDPFVRKEAIKSLLSFAGVAGTVLGLSKLAGAEVVTDPRNADFAKMKFGNTRYDILGGFQQPIRVASQLISGTVISSTSGREITLGEGYKPLTHFDVFQRFFESKTSPVTSFAIGLAKGQDAIGQDFHVPEEIMDRFIPMVVSDMYDLYQDRGLDGVVMWLPSPFGVGSQTYGKQELVFGKNKIGEESAQVRPVESIGGAIAQKAFGQYDVGSSRKYNVQDYIDELNNLPKDQANEIFEKIKKSNPDLAKQIVDIVKDQKKGITVHDEDLKSKGVESGDRAKAILKDLNKLKTDEEKRNLWNDYKKKGIITDRIAKQLYILISEQ